MISTRLAGLLCYFCTNSVFWGHFLLSPAPNRFYSFAADHPGSVSIVMLRCCGKVSLSTPVPSDNTPTEENQDCTLLASKNSLALFHACERTVNRWACGQWLDTKTWQVMWGSEVLTKAGPLRRHQSPKEVLCLSLT